MQTSPQQFWMLRETRCKKFLTPVSITNNGLIPQLKSSIKSNFALRFTVVGTQSKTDRSGRVSSTGRPQHQPKELTQSHPPEGILHRARGVSSQPCAPCTGPVSFLPGTSQWPCAPMTPQVQRLTRCPVWHYMKVLD